VARINVKTTVTAPEEINVPLVRADHSATSNIFRVFFEIGLSLFSTLLGYTLALPNPSKLNWLFLVIIGGFTIAFSVCSFRFAREARNI
jgi:hypothetical protein